ncbi:MAG: ComEC/Rec2 family competence protein, partial [Spirochaetota bacterium]
MLVVISAFCLASAGVTLLQIDRHATRRAGIFLLCFSTGLVIALFLQVKILSSDIFTGLPSRRVVGFAGRLSADSQKLKGGKRIYLLELEKVWDAGGSSADAFGKVRLIVDDGEELSWGRMITVNSRLNPPEDNNKPAEYLSFPKKSRVITNGYSSPVFMYRERIIKQLQQLVSQIGGPAANLFLALFLGVRDDLSSLDLYHFRKAGIMHILALSGMHLGIIAALVSLLLKPLIGKKGAFLITLVVILPYIFMAGLIPSLLRAGIMYLLGGTCLILNRRIDPVSILYLSFILLCIIDPVSAYSLSFQLSFLALFGIIKSGKKMRRLTAPYLPGFIGVPLACSIGAQ